MIEKHEGYRYFLQDGVLRGPYKIIFDYDPETLPPKAKYVTCHYTEPYKPVRGFRENLPKEKAKVRVDGPVAQLWLPIPSNDWAARAFFQHYTDLANKHLDAYKKALAKAEGAEKLKSGEIIEHPEFVKERGSDTYILHV